MVCKDCDKEVLVNWKICPYCGGILREICASFPCPNCSRGVQDDWMICPECGFRLKILSPSEGSSKRLRLRVSSGFSSLDPKYLKVVKMLLEMNMVYIYADDFIMGSEKYEEERPRREVYIHAFWMCKYTVTNEQYRFYCQKMGVSPSCFSNNPDFNWDKQPVVGVSFDETVKYCAWLKKKSGLSFRLPEEAEWEKAAGGTSARKYPWGNCWEHDRCHSNELHHHRTSEVTCYPYGLSPYGLFNMAGNVWEWCHDWYAADYYKESPISNPKGPKTGTEKVVRGGSWNSNGNDMRISKRKSFPPNSRQADIGFRMVCEDPIHLKR